MIRPLSLLFGSTRILFSIPARGLPATHSEIIESEPWSYICIEMGRHAGGCRTLISFVFNLNEEFCWGRLFPAYSWLLCVRVCPCTYMLHWLLLFSIRCPCQCITMTPFQIGWQIAIRQINDGVPICWKLNCFSMTLLFSCICSIMMFADMCHLGADDTLQYILYCNPLFTINQNFY